MHAREAGVASLMKALITPLECSGYQLFFDVDDAAAKILPAEPCDDLEQIDLVLSGYDDPLIDRTGFFLQSIAAYDIPVLGLLDSWRGVDRFWYASGIQRKLTHRLAVPNEAVKNYLLRRGIPSSCLVVTGHPGIGAIKQLSLRDKAEYRRQGRRKLRLNDDEKAMLLLSEPLRMPNGKRISLLDAISVTGETIEKNLENRYARKYRLICRLHPVELRVLGAAWLDGGSLSFEQALFASDYVVGLASTTMTYAVAADIRVDCLDLELFDWGPEYSDIPISLWRELIEQGVYQNNPEGMKFQCGKESEYAIEKILSQVESMMDK